MANVSALLHPPFVGDDGVWCQQVRAVSGEPRPALFLDRDGVIVEEVHATNDQRSGRDPCCKHAWPPCHRGD